MLPYIAYMDPMGTGSSHIPCDRASDMHPGLTLMTWNSLTVEITDVAPVVRSVAAGADSFWRTGAFLSPKSGWKTGNCRKMSSM